MGTNGSVMITGGGGGIGLELCRCFHRGGYDLFVVSLLKDELHRLKAELEGDDSRCSVITLQKDLSEVGAAEEVFAFSEKNGITVDVLVNNVGFGLEGIHLELPPERIRQMLVLNMMTLTMLCNHYGKKMKERGSGYILNVSSTISLQPLPYWAAYAGTKAYVSTFTQALSREMKGHGVSVSCLYPGITRTNFLSTAGLEQSNNKWSVGSLIHRAAMDPRTVARAGYRGLFRKKRRIFPGLINKFHFYFIHWVPNGIIVAVVNAVMRRYRRT